ncbi:hypothetical protein FRX31_031277 [Thalictrum thalictroides]|uniref:Uncharacterized protein n=1 Tax=Thalictrum thalictroides TaxID=46969 RepID=A0A7J6V4R1_THATH|nr:hypothetical protein FRX31_031277 [Thalictrum thalictroides]
MVQCEEDSMLQTDQQSSQPECSSSIPPGFGKAPNYLEITDKVETEPNDINPQTKEDFMKWIKQFVILKARSLGLSSHLGNEFVEKALQETGMKAVLEKENEILEEDLREQKNYKDSNLVITGDNVHHETTFTMTIKSITWNARGLCNTAVLV